MSANSQFKTSTMKPLVIKVKDVLVLRMPLPSSEECFLPPHIEEPSYLTPGTTIRDWPYHLATYHATVLEFLIQHSSRMNLEQVESLNILCSTKNTTIPYFLRVGWNLFSEENQAILFRTTHPSPQQKGSCFDSVLPLIGLTWCMISRNDIAAPWRDYMVRTAFHQRGVFEIRFYFFHMTVVQYFSIMTPARNNLLSGRRTNMSFSEQEYRVWCPLIAATLLLFRFKNLPQAERLVDAVMKVFEKAPVIKVDIMNRMERFLQMERIMLRRLGEMDEFSTANMYSVAYSDQALRVVRMLQASGLSVV